MNTLSKIFEFVTAMMARPNLAAAVLHENTLWRDKFRRRYGHTNHLPVLQFSDFVPDDATLDTYTFLGGGSMITDLLLLKHLAMRESTRNYFEIGMWRGESLMTVLDHVDRVYSLDQEIQKVPAQQRDQIGILLQKSNKIIEYKHDSLSFDFSSIGQSCDLIFIDGGHTYAHVLHDTTSVFKHVLNERSIVVWHDYGVHPEHIRWEVYLGIMDGVPQELHQHMYHVANTKCAVLIRDKDLRSASVPFPQEVKDVWEVNVKRRSK